MNSNATPLTNTGDLLVSTTLDKDQTVLGELLNINRVTTTPYP